MADARSQIESGFGRWARWVACHPWPIIFTMVVGSLGLATRIPSMEVETSSEDYLFDGDPAKIAYNAFRDQFGRDQLIHVLVEPKSVYDLDFLRWLEALHRDIEASVPHLDEVTSLVNARSVKGRGQTLQVDDLMLRFPQSAAELDALRERVESTPAYLDALISADGRVTALQVKSFAYSMQASTQESAREGAAGDLEGFEGEASPAPRRFLTARENSEFSRTLLAVVERHRRDDITIHTTGQPLVAFALTRSMAQDVPKIFASSLALIGVLLIALFRRISPLLLAAGMILLALVSTLGVAQLIGFPISLPTQILPSFMLAVGVGYVVHLLTLFFRALEDGAERPEAIERALRHVGLPIVLTAVTTAAGLVSFVAAEMEQAFQLGITGAIGVGLTLVHALVLLPAVLAVAPLRAKPGRARLEGASFLLGFCTRLSVRHPGKLVGAAAVLAVVSLLLLPRLDYSADPMTYFPEDHWLRVATHYADREMGGMQSLEVVIDTGEVNGLYEVDRLDRIDSLDRLIATLRDEGERVTRAWSLLQVLKETHQALNENRAAFYAIPRDRTLVAQELLLFENSGSDDLEPWVDSEFSRARVSVLTGWEDGVEKQRFIHRVGPRFREAIGDAGDVVLTGAVAMIARTASAASESMIQSYTLALLLITPLMVLMIGNLRAGLVSMVPNLVPILSALALMVLVGIELDMFTILGACIAIGLAVDDSIHFISGFRRHFAQTGDAARAVELTMESTGRALLFTSVVLVAGFGVLGLSSMANLGYLGATTAFAIGLAFLLDVTVTPALLVLTHRERTSREKEAGGV